MLLFDILFEADIPPTKYGYWIRPDGKFFPVNDKMGHEDMARDLVGGGKPSQESGHWTAEALWAGWVRVIDAIGDHSKTMYIEFDSALPQNLISIISRMNKDAPVDEFIINRRKFQTWMDANRYVRDAYQPHTRGQIM